MSSVQVRGAHQALLEQRSAAAIEGQERVLADNEQLRSSYRTLSLKYEEQASAHDALLRKLDEQMAALQALENNLEEQRALNRTLAQTIQRQSSRVEAMVPRVLRFAARHPPPGGVGLRMGGVEASGKTRRSSPKPCGDSTERVPRTAAVHCFCYLGRWSLPASSAAHSAGAPAAAQGWCASSCVAHGAPSVVESYWRRETAARACFSPGRSSGCTSREKCPLQLGQSWEGWNFGRRRWRRKHSKRSDCGQGSEQRSRRRKA